MGSAKNQLKHETNRNKIKINQKSSDFCFQKQKSNKNQNILFLVPFLFQQSYDDDSYRVLFLSHKVGDPSFNQGKLYIKMAPGSKRTYLI